MYIVYKHTNRIDNKIYIGITSLTLEKRWHSGYYNNPHFQSAIRKYGAENFSHEILAENLSKEQAEKLEMEYIKKYDSTNQKIGYNIELGGCSRGKHSEQTKVKISMAQKGRKMPEEQKAKLRKPKNVKYTEEELKRRSEIMKGNKRTLGRKHTSEELKKISEGNMGKHGKKVICSDGNIFNSATDAAKHYGLQRHSVMNLCNGKTRKIAHCNLLFSYL